jgi:RimJ/RimL family protein N-acetyltransferase
MMNEVARLSFRALTPVEAHVIVAGRRAGRTWAPDYPSLGDVNVAHAALEGKLAFANDAMPWGLYVVVENSSGMSIGGVGFTSLPNELGEVEIGYGICRSFEGKGMATESVLAMCEIAGSGISAILADTERDNVASQRVLQKCGFQIVGNTDDLVRWRKSLAPSDA